MNKDTLQTALQLSQLITLLTPLGRSSKHCMKRLSALRSILHEQVLLCAHSAVPSEVQSAELTLKTMHGALHDAIMRNLDVTKLISNPKGALSPYAAAKGKDLARSADYGCDFLLGDALHVERGTEVSKFSDEVRSPTIRAFTSASNNSNWMPTLLTLVGPLEASGASGRMRSAYSSGQGRAQLIGNLQRLCADLATQDTSSAKKRKSASRAPTVDVSRLVVLHVSLPMENLLREPHIAELSNHFLPDGSEPTGLALRDMFQEAAAPHALGAEETPQSVAQARLDTLLAKLTDRANAIQAERVRLKKEAEKHAQAATLDAIKKLDPKLLRALKANPDLLRKA